jgi:hypothetical protein
MADLHGEYASEDTTLARVAVILHERLGNWARQLRPRLFGLPIRWFETRSLADLESVIAGMACPLVLVDLGSRPVPGLLAVRATFRRATDARVLVLDPKVHSEATSLARELGATHVISGFVPPPVVESLIRRWVELAKTATEHAGWSKALPPEAESEPWSWLAEYLGDPAGARMPHPGAFSVPSRRQFTEPGPWKSRVIEIEEAAGSQ